jgi:hypothetical protein
VSEFVGAMQERIEVLVLAFGRVEPEVVGALRRQRLHVGRAGARVVDPDLLAHTTAEEIAQRQVGRLPEDVPQRDVDRSAPAHFGAGADEADIADQVRLLRLDITGVFADEPWRNELVDMRFGRSRAVKGLAEADQPLIRLDLDPEKVGKFVNADSLDRRDFHGRPPAACVLLQST